MYKILIVEDEHIVRLALKSLIDWEKHHIEFVAEAVNGKEALDIMKQQDIDLVITDINMPVMNGLELIKAIQDKEENKSIIVLSAYNDYQYVRQAFKLGVEDYILKSELDPDAVLSLVLKVLSKKHGNKNSKQSQQTGKLLDSTLILKSLAEGVHTIDNEVISQLESDISIKGNYICCVLLVDEFKRVVSGFNNKEIASFSKHIVDTIKLRLGKEVIGQVICMQPNTYMILYHAKDSSEANYRKKIEVLLKSIQQSLEVYLDIKVSIGVAFHGNSIYRLNDKYSEAMELANLRYIYGKGRIIYSENANFIKQIETERIIGQESELIGAIKELDPIRVDQELDYLLNRIAAYKGKSIKDLIGFYLELILIIIVNCSEIEGEALNVFEHNTNFYSMMNQFETKEEIHLWIKNFVKNILAYLTRHQHQDENYTIKKAKQYIKKHYAGSISLSSVSDYVELSESYFSKLFVKETGETFIQYLTRYRIDKACDLLAESNMKVYEIASGVGYENVEHFSRIFKKAIGMSPNSYKRRITK